MSPTIVTVDCGLPAVPKRAGVPVASSVRVRRTALELTQQELADELGVTHQHVSRIEAGHAVPSLEMLVRLSRRLSVSTDYLLTGREMVPWTSWGRSGATGA